MAFIIALAALGQRHSKETERLEKRVRDLEDKINNKQQ